MKPSSPPRILLIDDHPYSRLMAIDTLQLDVYDVIESDGNPDVFQLVQELQPDLILMDVYLADKDGIDLCKVIKQTVSTAAIPVILMTAMDDPNIRLRSRQSGADAFLLKPLDRVELLNRIDLLIQKKQLAESVAQIEQVLFRVAAVIEERYDIGKARLTVSELVIGFGEFLGLDRVDIEDLVFAARLHDLGMIQIPDSVMVKQGTLEPEELRLVKQHVHVGATIFEPLTHRQSVGQIMRYHHERWDGSGYPDGLRGDNIPYLAQIFQIIDIFSALTAPRSYKTAISTDQALKILQEEAKAGWRNPDLVQQFCTFIAQTPAELVPLTPP
ncbi:MAG: HD domain-containing phosphohydrolase [Synechocystis sp.]|nr:HD domain-containing phosphohydrolase [Synechocystis sp.]